jgi:hypothetical protein
VRGTPEAAKPRLYTEYVTTSRHPLIMLRSP